MSMHSFISVSVCVFAPSQGCEAWWWRWWSLPSCPPWPPSSTAPAPSSPWICGRLSEPKRLSLSSWLWAGRHSEIERGAAAFWNTSGKFSIFWGIILLPAAWFFHWTFNVKVKILTCHGEHFIPTLAFYNLKSNRTSNCNAFWMKSSTKLQIELLHFSVMLTQTLTSLSTYS